MNGIRIVGAAVLIAILPGTAGCRAGVCVTQGVDHGATCHVPRSHPQPTPRPSVPNTPTEQTP